MYRRISREITRSSISRFALTLMFAGYCAATLFFADTEAVPEAADLLLRRITVYADTPREGGVFDAHGYKLRTLARRGINVCAIHPQEKEIEQFDTLIVSGIRYVVRDWTASDTSLLGVVDLFDSLATDKRRWRNEQLLIERRSHARNDTRSSRSRHSCLHE